MYNGKVEYNRSYVYREKLAVVCDEGNIEEHEVTCTSRGLWSSVPKCVNSGTGMQLIWQS